jgi:hypothetical protein
MPEENEAPVVEPQDKKPEWDKERQRADQAEANSRKTAAKLSATELKTNQLEQTVAELQGKLQTIEDVKGLDLSAINPDDADIPDVVRNQAKVVQALEKTQAKLSALEQKAASYEQNELQSRQVRERESVIEKIMNPLDKEFGAKYRNEARKLAEAEVEERGYAPNGELECYQMLRRHYETLKTKGVESASKETPSDNGRGGSKSSFGDSIKPGTVDDVMAQIRKGGGIAAMKK